MSPTYKKLKKFLETVKLTDKDKEVLIKVLNDLETKDLEIKRLNRDVNDFGPIVDALAWYADEGIYHAVGFSFDRPCGQFETDFSRDPGSEYDYPKPGKRARKAFKKYWSKKSKQTSDSEELNSD